jgi:membrane associated rhomboid family serine protease
LLDLRGGAKKRKSRTGSLAKTVTGKTKVGAKKSSETKKSGNLGGPLLEYYNGIPSLTRLYAQSFLICSVLAIVLGDERAQAVLALDPMRTIYGLELWRPITSASFMGKPSISWLLSGYHLVEYGSSLEKAYGTAEYLLFLATQIVLLTMMSSLLGIPFFAQAVVTGMLHVLSRATPQQKVKWMVVTVPFYLLPYGLMVADCLQAKSAGAAVPHIMGILSGHFYQFHRFIWPKTGGEEWLRAPDFLVRRLDPQAASRDAAKESIAKALKKRKRGKGKKLGSAV